LTREDRKIFQDTALEVEVWNMKETLNVLEKIKKDIVAKGGKIHVSSDEEKKMYMKDSYSLWPEVEKASGEMGKKFINILKKYR